MEEKKKKEGLQSRRQFFKKAAKGALPILGAIALTQVPFLSQAHESQNEMGCNYGCLDSCYQTCSAGCKNGCIYSCSSSCKGSCTGSCARTCFGACYGTCDGTCARYLR